MNRKLGARSPASRLASSVVAIFLIAGAFVAPGAGAQGSPAFTISATPASAQVGTSVSITGKICPAPNAPLGVDANITYTAPNGTQFARSGFLGYGGSGFCGSPFALDALSPDSPGTWSALAWAYWQDPSGSYVQVESAAITILATAPTSTTTTTTTRTTTAQPPPAPAVQGAGNQTISQGYYYDWTVNVPSTSYAVYASMSNVSVSDAFMSAAQFGAFSGGGSMSNALSHHDGTAVLDGLLVPPGSYYFVVAALDGSAGVQYYYSANNTLAVQNDTTDVGEFLPLAPTGSGPPYSVPLHVETLGSPTTLSFFGISNQTLSYSVYDVSTASTVFSSPRVTTTNFDGTLSNFSSFNPDYNVSLPVGEYDLLISNAHPTPAYAYLSYSLSPAYVNPYLLSGLGGPKPTGIASFGVLNDSGRLSPYTIDTPAVAGFANITALQATDINASSVGVPQSSSTLQLNAIVVATNDDGTQFEYWSQNVPQFLASNGASYLSFVDNVWNMTGDGATLSNATIASSAYGFVSGYGGFYYACYPFNCNYVFPYNFPLAFVVGMNVTAVPGSGLYIGFAEEMLQNGTAVQSPQNVWYDKVFITDPNIYSAAFHTTGSDYTPAGAKTAQGLYFDTELVFGGDSGGSTSTFQNLRATLGLYYLNSTTGLSSTFPSYYSFGSDTAENTPSVQVNYLGSGLVQTSASSPDYVYLTAPPPAPATTTTSTSPPPGPTTTTSSKSSTGTNGGIPEFPYQAIAIPIVGAVVVGAYFLSRKRFPPAA